MWSAGGKRGEQYLERSERRTPPPYNRPRSHRACTATVEAVWAGGLWAMSSTKWSILVPTMLAGAGASVGTLAKEAERFRSREDGDEGNSRAPEPSSQRKGARLRKIIGS